jgi:RNA polymerase sigma factor (sigma-70 family)
VQRDLVIRAQGGDHEAFAALVAGSIDRLFNVARLIVRSNDLAEDAVEAALLGGWTTIRGLRDPDHFDAWIQQLLVRACYRSARQGRGRRAMDISSVSVAGARGRDPEQSVARRDQLERGFGRLSPDQRTVLVVHYFLELRDHEAAQVLGIRRGTLESGLNRATGALRAALDAEERRGVAGAGAAPITAHDALERTLGEWFHADARERAPSALLDAVFAGARRHPLRPALGVALRRIGMGRRARSRRVVLRLSLLVALGSLLIVGVILVGPQRPPRLGVGWLAYVHEGDVYIADSAGNGSRRIAHADGVTFDDIAWSPDGRRLVAEADSGTILIDPLAESATSVGGTRPAWSPDSQQLAVVDDVPEGSRVRIIDAATLSTVRTYPFSAGGGLAWSPNAAGLPRAEIVRDPHAHRFRAARRARSSGSTLPPGRSSSSTCHPGSPGLRANRPGRPIRDRSPTSGGPSGAGASVAARRTCSSPTRTARGAGSSIE